MALLSAEVPEESNGISGAYTLVSQADGSELPGDCTLQRVGISKAPSAEGLVGFIFPAWAKRLLTFENGKVREDRIIT